MEIPLVFFFSLFFSQNYTKKRDYLRSMERIEVFEPQTLRHDNDLVIPPLLPFETLDFSFLSITFSDVQLRCAPVVLWWRDYLLGWGMEKKGR